MLGLFSLKILILKVAWWSISASYSKLTTEIDLLFLKNKKWTVLESNDIVYFSEILIAKHRKRESQVIFAFLVMESQLLCIKSDKSKKFEMLPYIFIMSKIKKQSRLLLIAFGLSISWKEKCFRGKLTSSSNKTFG